MVDVTQVVKVLVKEVAQQDVKMFVPDVAQLARTVVLLDVLEDVQAVDTNRQL